jgi:hypothetical protein
LTCLTNHQDSTFRGPPGPLRPWRAAPTARFWRRSERRIGPPLLPKPWSDGKPQSLQRPEIATRPEWGFGLFWVGSGQGAVPTLASSGHRIDLASGRFGTESASRRRPQPARRRRAGQRGRRRARADRAARQGAPPRRQRARVLDSGQSQEIVGSAQVGAVRQMAVLKVYCYDDPELPHSGNGAVPAAWRMSSARASELVILHARPVEEPRAA